MINVLIFEHYSKTCLKRPLKKIWFDDRSMLSPAMTVIKTFSEYGRVALQIKGNDACSNMVAKSLPVDSPSPTLRGRVKIQLFQNMVMLHIKLKGMTNAAICKHIFCPYTHP